jgi:excisionase family DNA binding protein
MEPRDNQNTTRRREQAARKRLVRQAHEQSVAVERFITIVAVADLLGVSERTVRRWIEREELAKHDFGNITCIGERDLRALISGARRGPPAPHANDPLQDDFYTAEEVAELLGVCIKTVRRRVKTKALVEHSFGGIIRIARSDLQAFVVRCRRD